MSIRKLVAPSVIKLVFAFMTSHLRVINSVFLAFGLASHAAGCAFSLQIPGEITTVTLQPVQQASLIHYESQEFGVCLPILLSPAFPPIESWVFYTSDPPINTTVSESVLTGYEISVSRGDVCHARTLGAFQGAILFNIASLPSSAIESADLSFTRSSVTDLGTNPRGTAAACLGIEIELGTATHSWRAGKYRNTIFRPIGVDDPTRGRFIYSNRLVRVLNQGRARETIDVSQRVRLWRLGQRDNNGFVFTPDLAALITQLGMSDNPASTFSCDYYLTDIELVVRVVDPTL